MNYHISRNGQQSDGLTELDIRTRLNSGELSPNDLCWTEGMAEWQPIGMVFPVAQAPTAYPSSIPAAPTLNPYAPPQAELRPLAAAGTPLAGLGQRLGATLVDGLFGMIAAAPFFVASVLMENTNPEIDGIPSTALSLMGVGGVLALGLMIYNIVLLSTKGQTIGKKILGIRISNYQDNGNPGFVKAVLLRGIVNGILGFIPLYGLVDICFIFGQERRCIHDLIASTRVVQC